MMIVQIQYLRGIAAMLVVFYHLSYRLASMSSGPAADWALLGTSGVEIFFVVSGFIMWLTTAYDSVSPRQFYARRIARIVPLYWTLTLAVAAIMLCAPHLLSSSKFDPTQLLASLAFVTWPHEATADKLSPVVFTGWTLNYEMFFYALFGAFLFVPRRWRLFGVAGILVALVAFGILCPALGPVTAFYTSPMLLEFVFGMMLAALYAAVPRIDGRIALATLCVGIGALVAGIGARGVDRVITFGLPAVLIVFGTLYLWGGRNPTVARPLLAFGEASYAIYLSQVLPLAGFPVARKAAGLPAGGAWDLAFLLSGMGVVIVCGFAAHLWVEKPLANLIGTRCPVPARRHVRQSRLPAPTTGGAVHVRGLATASRGLKLSHHGVPPGTPRADA